MERIGHRGAKREHPENTIAAFKTAFARGADAVELDVHGTRDGALVVHHDPTLGPVHGDASGRAIAELDWSTIGRSSMTAATRIPTLPDVFAVIPAAGTVYVEIKGHGIESLVRDVVGAAKVRCAVHSFDHDAIRLMRQLAPQVPRGILYDHRPADVERDMKSTGARDVWPNWKLIDRTLVERVHAAGGRVLAWTVNDVEAAKALVALGVDGLCTDDVRLLDGL
jgi:glycerophosphoryl diester phosphodiesterase